MASALPTLLQNALAAREGLMEPKHQTAFRLFNGFTEGNPNLAVDVYARTLVLHDYSDTPEAGTAFVADALDTLCNALPWLAAGIVKSRNAPTAEAKRGQLVFGTQPDTKVQEAGVWYAIDLTLNRDASLYLDTRNLRSWVRENLTGKSLLNTFAYTGSLGVAATAGGANPVVQLDLNRQFLNVAKTSYTLNGFPIDKRNFVAADFFTEVNRLKRANARFDCVLIDPPFFATSPKGKVDLENDSARLINKVRPLINDGGTLVAINNALYVSGQAYLQTLEALCADGYLAIETLIPVPSDFTGYPTTRVGAPNGRGATITDPAPFNHSTKIAVLKVRRK